jgi:4'-phosphopantetheinyl transferase
MTSIYWSLVQSSEAPLDHPEAFLSPSESTKYASLHFPKRAQEWLLGRWTGKRLVQSLPEFQAYSLGDINIRNLPDGAPYIVLPGQSASPGCLSLSHCEGAALAAFSAEADLRIGVDLEKVELRSRAFVEDYFTQVEQDLVEAFPDDVRIRLVNLIWSAKESMLKALGVGLHWDTRKVETWQVDGLFPFHPEISDWQSMRLGECEAAGRHWTGWWKSHGDFVLTLAGYAPAASLPTLELIERIP